MACNCGSARKVVIYESHRPDGSIKRYLTELEARRDVDAHGGQCKQVTQTAR